MLDLAQNNSIISRLCLDREYRVWGFPLAKNNVKRIFNEKRFVFIFTRLLCDFSSVWEAFEVLRASLGRLWVALGRLLGRLLGGSWAALGGSQANVESRSPKLLPYRFLQRFFASGPVPVITGRKPPPVSIGYFEGCGQGVWG